MRVHEAAKDLGVSPSTIRYYCNSGQLETLKTPGGQRNITKQAIEKFKQEHNMPTTIQNQNIAFYIRSSSGDKKLLQAQENELTLTYGTPTKTYTDRASGLNEKRPGLTQLIKDVEQGKYDKVCITYKDRLTRFGFTYLQHIITRTGTKLEVLHADKKYSLEQELMDDFMSLIASFSGRFYRLRGKKQQKQLLQDAQARVDDENEE